MEIKKFCNDRLLEIGLKPIMNYCLNPLCRNPQNPGDTIICRSCGQTILLDDRYLPLSFLGGGGQGRNYLAIDRKTPTKKRCVIKQLCPHPNIANNPSNLKKATELFNREATVLDELGDESSQIPRLLAHLQQEGYLYLVQEFIDGQNLLKELNQKGCFSELEISDFLQEILPVLNFIHSRRVIHRDIKPENIMRRSSHSTASKTDRSDLVLIDFGLSKQLSQTIMAVGTIGGTMGYASQEQLLYGEAYFASDLYALGATCIHLLTGTLPHQLYNPRTKSWLWQEVLSQRGIYVGDNLSQVLDKMLMVEVNERYQSVDEILEFLKPVKTLVAIPPVNKSKNNIVKQIYRFLNKIYCRSVSSRCIQTINEIYNQENDTGWIKKSFSFRNLEFSPDGQTLATSYYDTPVIKLWNWMTGDLITTYNSKKYHTFTFHLNGAIIGLSEQWNANLNFIKTDNNQEIKQINIGQYLDDCGNISPLAISPNGQFIATVTYITSPIRDNCHFDFPGVKVVDLTSAKGSLRNIKYCLDRHYILPSCLCFDPNSKILASSGNDGLINLWDLKTGNLMRTIKPLQWNLEFLEINGREIINPWSACSPELVIKTINFNPKRELLASGGCDNLIKFWNYRNGQLIKILSGHKDSINSLAFSPDGQLLASGSNDKTVKVWDVSTGDILYDLTEHTGFVNCVAFTPDGKIVASSSNDKTIKIWQLNLGY